jgi:hypothetical protein
MTSRDGRRLAIASALLYTLAFNLTFFIQELFLVVPKAFVPELQPTLFHNNHLWLGHHPLENLFQGTGALATFISGVVCIMLLRGRRVTSTTGRLLLFWMAFSGFFMSLPQVVVGALVPENDVGMAMDYLQLDTGGKAVAAVAALAAIAPISIALSRILFGFAQDPADVGSGFARTRFVFRLATLPALAAIPLIFAFRVPRNWIEVAIVPVVVTIVGVIAIHSVAWRVESKGVTQDAPPVSIAFVLAAVIALLLVFQLVLRRGIAFY